MSSLKHQHHGSFNYFGEKQTFRSPARRVILQCIATIGRMHQSAREIEEKRFVLLSRGIDKVLSSRHHPFRIVAKIVILEDVGVIPSIDIFKTGTLYQTGALCIERGAPRRLQIAASEPIAVVRGRHQMPFPHHSRRIPIVLEDSRQIILCVVII